MRPVPKTKRVTSLKNINAVSRLPCSVCYAPNVDVHHFKSKGSGGGDELENLVSLCRRHHNEFHNLGVETWTKKYKTQVDLFRALYKMPPLNYST